MSSNKSNPFPVLLRIWLVLSTFTNVVALASLTDGLIAWTDFVQEMIVSYSTIRDMVWSNLFGAFHIEMPKWAHDYFTINSIFAVSILWAMIDGARSISSNKLNSAILYLKNSVLNVKIGAQVPIHTAKETEAALSAAGVPSTAEQSKRLSGLAQPIVSIYTVLKSLLMTVLVSASYFTFAFAFPLVIQINDRLDARLAAFEFQRLEDKFRSIPWESVQLDILLKIFKKNIAQFAAFAAMDDLFHKTLQRSLVRYLIAVALLFVGLVFANHVLTAII